MKIKYDKNIDTKYIYIKKGKINKTKKQKDWLFFDYAKNGDILGVEILNASENLFSLSTIKDKLFSGGTVLYTNTKNDLKDKNTVLDLRVHQSKQFTREIPWFKNKDVQVPQQ